MAEFCNELGLERNKYPADGSSEKDLQYIGQTASKPVRKYLVARNNLWK
jgi:hypothetical protein